ncbi:MAG: hypothetical protein IPP29_17260 [Bacteroidetes bacterium]|nr:hypothetical protein [Bacteroidota bacterium]
MFAQPNLIPNPSFEQYYSCPDNTAQVDSCVGWNLIWNTPDYFNACTNVWFVDVPTNWVGNHFAFDGNGYMGLACYVPPPIELYREIIGCYLIDSLIIGNSYHFSMRVVRSGNIFSYFGATAANKIGARFSNDKPQNFDSTYINNYATLYSDTIIADSLNWTLLCWDFIADSNYKYISIGNFFDNQFTDTIILPPFNSINSGPYYYCLFDSLNLTCTSTNCNSSIDDNAYNNFVLYYNNKINKLTIEYDFDFQLRIINLLGQEVFQNDFKKHAEINTEFFNNEIYIINIRNKKSIQILTKNFIN